MEGGPPKLNLSSLKGGWKGGSDMETPSLESFEQPTFDFSNLDCYASVTHPGFRTFQEDMVAVKNFADTYNFIEKAYMVIDGHGGNDSALFLKNNFLDLVEMKLKDITCTEMARLAIVECFKEIELKWAENRKDTSGACVLLCLQLSQLNDSGTKSFLIASCGDCRTQIVRKDATFDFLTVEHDPNIPEERERINKAGLYVSKGRVIGELAVSRSIGDFEYKGELENQEDHAVTCVPEIILYDFHPEDSRLVLMTDGFYEQMESKVLAQFCSDESNDSKQMVQNMFQRAIDLRTNDNLTAIIIS
jgi:serine/threonine protein phosphatase PrpC